MIRNKIFPWAVTALLFFSACEKDELTDRPDSGTDQHLPHTGEQFIVDYTVGNGETRSGETNEPDNRIKSILYLLYQDGTLVKKREIPLKSGETHFQFPMTRDNMSWEQREALKDTLDINTTYTAVFVANAEEGKTLLLDKMEGGETIPRPFSEICLQLPETAITEEDEMFYLFTQEILSSDEGADRDNPYNCPVMLQRVVSKTEFRRLLVSEEDKEYQFCQLYQTLKGNEGSIYKNVEVSMEAFKKKLSAMTPTQDSPYYQDMQDLLSSINDATYQTLITTIDKSLFDQLKTDFEANTNVKSAMSSWQGNAKVIYKDNSLAHQLVVIDKSSKSDRSESPEIAIADDSFIFYSFGEDDKTPGLNTISAVRIGESEILMNDGAMQGGNKGNESVVFVYNPFEGLQCTGTKTKDFKENVNFVTLLGLTDKTEFVTEIEKYLNQGIAEGQKTVSLSDYLFTFQIPDLSNLSELTVSGSWSKRDNNEVMPL